VKGKVGACGYERMTKRCAVGAGVQKWRGGDDDAEKRTPRTLMP
jgi:hypothetical protein